METGTKLQQPSQAQKDTFITITISTSSYELKHMLLNLAE